MDGNGTKRSSLYQYYLLLSGKLAGAINVVYMTTACFPTSESLKFIMKQRACSFSIACE